MARKAKFLEVIGNVASTIYLTKEQLTLRLKQARKIEREEFGYKLHMGESKLVVMSLRAIDNHLINMKIPSGIGINQWVHNIYKNPELLEVDSHGTNNNI